MAAATHPPHSPRLPTSEKHTRLLGPAAAKPQNSISGQVCPLISGSESRGWKAGIRRGGALEGR